MGHSLHRPDRQPIPHRRDDRSGYRRSPIAASVRHGRAVVDTMNTDEKPVFYTVAETARLLRVNRATVYRAIQDDGFPAVRIRGRYIIPAAAIEQLIARVTESGGCLDIAALAEERRTAREVRRLGEDQP